MLPMLVQVTEHGRNMLGVNLANSLSRLVCPYKYLFVAFNIQVLCQYKHQSTHCDNSGSIRSYVLAILCGCVWSVFVVSPVQWRLPRYRTLASRNGFHCKLHLKHRRSLGVFGWIGMPRQQRFPYEQEWFACHVPLFRLCEWLVPTQQFLGLASEITQGTAAKDYDWVRNSS